MDALSLIKGKMWIIIFDSNIKLDANLLPRPIEINTFSTLKFKIDQFKRKISIIVFCISPGVNKRKFLTP